MAKYRRKDGGSEAFQMTAEICKNGGPFPDWVQSGVQKPSKGYGLVALTAGGRVRLFAGDWLLQRNDGTVFVLTDGDFKRLYEEVESK